MSPYLALLVPALVAVESGGNRLAVSPDGRHVGPLQISQAVLDDVNMLHGVPHFTRMDCFSYVRSCAIFDAYVRMWATPERCGHVPTLRDYALCWHFGPGMGKDALPDDYWTRVNNLLPIARYDGWFGEVEDPDGFEQWTVIREIPGLLSGGSYSRATIEAKGIRLPLAPAVGMAGGVQL